MINLIKKDLILHKKGIIIFLIVISLYNPIMMIDINGRGFLAICFLWSFMLPIIVTLREEKFSGNLLFCSLPYTRGQVVLSRYFSSWMLMFLGLGFSLVFNLLINYILFNGNSSFYDDITTLGMVGGFIFIALLNGVWLPINFRFGLGKGFIVALLAGGFLAFMLGYFFLLTNHSANPLKYIHLAVDSVYGFLAIIYQIGGNLLVIIAGILIVLLINVLSWGCSYMIFQNREL